MEHWPEMGQQVSLLIQEIKIAQKLHYPPVITLITMFYWKFEIKESFDLHLHFSNLHI